MIMKLCQVRSARSDLTEKVNRGCLSSNAHSFVIVGFFVLFWVDGRLRSTQHWAGRWEEKRAVSLKPRDNVEKQCTRLEGNGEKICVICGFQEGQSPSGIFEREGGGSCCHSERRHATCLKV